MRPLLLILFLLPATVPGLYSQQKPLNPPLTVDSFFSDSGTGFDGHYNRCVWICCTKRPHRGDTIRIVKLCGGMIGGCPDSWTLHRWKGTGWQLEHSRNYRYRNKYNISVWIGKEYLSICKGRRCHQLKPAHGNGPLFQHYVLL